jgi:hypothetical protein
MATTFNPQAAADQARYTYRRKSKRVSTAWNPPALRGLEAESETGPDDYSYRVIGLGMAALSGMTMGFLIGWVFCASL